MSVNFGGLCAEFAVQNPQLLGFRSFSSLSNNGGHRKNLPWLNDSSSSSTGRRNDKFRKVKSSSSGGDSSNGSKSSWGISAENFVKRSGGSEVEVAEDWQKPRVRRDVRDDDKGREEGGVLRKVKVGSSRSSIGSKSSWERSRAVDVVEDWRKPRERRYERGEEDGEEVSDEDDGVVSDPRWDTIRTRAGRVVDVGRGSSDRPEIRGRWNREETWGRKTYREASESTVPKMVGEGLYGVGPILAALSAGRREFYALYVQEGLESSKSNKKRKDKKGFEKVLKIADKLGLTLREVSKHDLNMVADNRPHQGLVLDTSPLEMVNIKELETVSSEHDKGVLWVALDEVTDPQNLGAIIRSSYFFGAAGVVLCAKNSAPLSGVVSKASAGSLELMEMRSGKNMMQFLTSSAENGWRVVGGSVSSRAVPLREVAPGAPTILVLGNEGTGLRPLVERSCTQLVKIPGNIPLDVTAGRFEDDKDEPAEELESSGDEFQSFMAVESLNVSVAAGVLLHHFIGNNYTMNHPGVADNVAHN